MTKFEDLLREALAVDDRPVNQLGAARYAYAMSHQKTHTSVIEDAAALLLEILPEIRELVEPKGRSSSSALRSIMEREARSLRKAAKLHKEKNPTPLCRIAEKLKKAGVI